MYNFLLYRRNGIILWKHDNASHDYLVGFLLGLRSVLPEHFDKSRDVLQIDNKILKVFGKHGKLLRPYQHSDFTQAGDDYFWYLRSATNLSTELTLYHFADIEFISGFMDATALFGKDFRDYSAGTPFTVNIINSQVQFVWHNIRDI